MSQRNYLINTTALSLTASGTTVASGNTVNASFEVARTLVRTGLGADELAAGSHSWFIHYVVSEMATPYEMRLKLQRRNSGGVVQSESGYGIVRSTTGTYDDDITWDSGTWNADDQLALVWEHRRPSGTGSKNGTIDANGASYIDASTGPSPSLSPSTSLSPSASVSPSVSPSASVSPSSSESPSTSPSSSLSPSASVSPSLSPSASESPSSSESPSISPSASVSPSASESPSVSLSLSPSASVSPSLSPSSSPSPSEPPEPQIIFLDPGGDAVQEVNYFALAQGTNAPTFDTSQKINGLGSYKFDSGAGNGNSYNKVAGVLGASRRITRWVRFDSVPNTDAVDSQFTNSQVAYSGGGFTTPFNLQADDASYATATPAKNGAQGSTLSFPMVVPTDAIIDLIKIRYKRKYDTAASIGTSRVRYLVGAEEGPNHDNTDMPTTDTVVEVDITTDRSWTHAEVNAIKVIAEALRGDTDTAHTQSWDYVRVEVEYHTAIAIFTGQETTGGSILRLYVLPAGSGMVLRLKDAGDFTFDGITVIPPDEWHRIALCFNQNDVDNLDVKLYVDAVEELSLVGRGTNGSGVGGWPDLVYGWIDAPGANQVCWVDQIWMDDGNDLSDPRPKLFTAKRGASTNVNDFDTTGGTGAVNERPVNLANYRQQAGTQVSQNYTLEAADVGDVDISGEAIVGYMGWVIAKRGALPTSTIALTLNGNNTVISPALTVTPSLRTVPVTSSSYPSNAAGIGIVSSANSSDTFLYECGVIVAYEGPVEEILFAEYLLLEDQTAEVVDDLRASPPSSYMLRYWIGEGGGKVKITAYSITSEGESPRAWPIIESNGGKGQARIGIPGIEVRIIMEVTEADTYVMLQGYPNQ